MAIDKISMHWPYISASSSGLTVGEMIAYLEKLDPTAPVLIPAENGGLEEIVLVTERGVRLNVNHAEGFGPHEVPEFGEAPDTDAVLLLSAHGLTSPSR